MKTNIRILLASGLIVLTGCSSGLSDAISNGNGNSNGTSTDVNNSNLIRTRLEINGAPSLPHFLSSEVENSLEFDSLPISIKSYFGHLSFIDETCDLGEISIPLSEKENYIFSLELKINDGESQEILTDIDYLGDDYIVTVEDNYENEQYIGSVVNYTLGQKLSIEKNLLLSETGKGRFNVDLVVTNVETQQKDYISGSTIYYAIADGTIVFGLTSNPILYEGEEGTSGCGWIVI